MDTKCERVFVNANECNELGAGFDATIASRPGIAHVYEVSIKGPARISRQLGLG